MVRENFPSFRPGNVAHRELQYGSFCMVLFHFYTTTKMLFSQKHKTAHMGGFVRKIENVNCNCYFNVLRPARIVLTSSRAVLRFVEEDFMSARAESNAALLEAATVAFP